MTTLQELKKQVADLAAGKPFIIHYDSEAAEDMARIADKAHEANRKRIAELEAKLKGRVDRIFIDHIQAHLKPGEKVICKICGKTADAICAELEKEE